MAKHQVEAKVGAGAGSSSPRHAEAEAHESANPRWATLALRGAAAGAGAGSGGSEGSALSPQAQAHFGRLFGYDFSGVRVHRSADAAALTQERRARALTYGADVAVSARHQDLDAPQSRKVLAHELAHVVQQGRVGARGPAAGLRHEHEARRAADRVSRGRPVGPLSPARPSVQADDEQPTPLPSTAAPPARPALTRAATNPVHVPLDRRMWFRSSMFANDEAYLRQMLAGHMAVSGTEATRRLVREFVRTRGREEQLGGVRIIGLPAHTYGARRGSMVRSPLDVMREDARRAARDRVLAANADGIIEKIQRIIAELDTERATFMTTFAQRAGGTLVDVLQEGERGLIAEQIRYGLEREQREVRNWRRGDHGGRYLETSTETSYSMGGASPDTEGMAGAAQDLLAKHDQIDGIIRQQTAWGVRTSGASRPGAPSLRISAEDMAELSRLNRELTARTNELGLLRQLNTRRYPLLGAITDDRDALRQVARGAGQRTADVLGEALWGRIARIQQTRADYNRGSIDVWRLPNILEIAKSTAGIRAHGLQAKWIEEQATSTREANEFYNTVLTVIGIALAVVGSVATMGGATVIAAGLAVGAAGTGALSLHEAVSRYQHQRADSFHDRAFAICGDDPTQLWIALEVAALILDVVQAGAALRAVSNSAKAAARASARTAAALTDDAAEIAEARRVGLGARIRDAIGRMRGANNMDEAVAGAAGHHGRRLAAAEASLDASARSNQAATLPMRVGSHSIKVSPTGLIARCTTCGFLRAEYAAELATSRDGDRVLWNLMAGAETLAEQSNTARLAGDLNGARRLRDQAARQARNAAEQLEFARRAASNAPPPSGVAALLADRNLVEGMDPVLFDAATARMPQGLQSQLRASPALQRALHNADYNPRRLTEAWRRYPSRADLRPEDFTDYIRSHRGFVTASGERANRLLTEAIPNWASLNTAGRGRALLNEAESRLLTVLNTGTPADLAAQIRAVLDDNALITRIIGRAERVNGPRRSLMSAINQRLGEQATDSAQFARWSNYLDSPSNRGSMGEYFAHRRLFGGSTSRHARFERDAVPGLNRSPFTPDLLDSAGHRTIDIKTGYTNTDIDILQAQDYHRLRTVSHTNADVATQLGGPIQRHDYVFLPSGSGNARDAAVRAYNLLQRRNLLTNMRVYYVDSTGAMVRYLPPPATP